MVIDRFRFRSMRTKITLVYSVIFGAILTLVGLAVLISIKINAERDVKGELAASVAVFEKLWDLTEEQLAAAAGILASDFGFREAVATEDVATIASALQNLGYRFEGVDALIVFPDGRLLQSDETVIDAPDGLLNALISEGSPSGVIWIDGTPVQAVAVPVRAPMIVGWVVFSVKMDSGRMSALEDLSAIPVTASLRSLQNVEAQAHQGSIVATRVLEGFGEEQGAELVIDYPRDAAMKPYQPMLLAIFGFSLAGIGLAIASGVAVARSLTRPIKLLDQAARAMSAGRRETVSVTSHDEIGRLADSFNVMQDNIASRERDIQELARRDRETGLPNRLALDEAFNAAAAEADPLQVLIIRVRRFQHVRAAIGHSASAKALELLAMRLQGFLPGETIYRVSATDLCVLARSSTTPREEAGIRRLVMACSQPVTIENETVDLLLCAGIAASGNAELVSIGTVDQAIVAADQADAGQLLVNVFDLDAYGNPVETLSLMSAMLGAMNDGDLFLAYQPKYGLQSDEIQGLEALIRWRHPVRGMIAPDQFIPIAEETGHIRQLTEWVVQRAIEDQRLLEAGGFSLPVSVNVSGRQICDDSFAMWAIGIVKNARAKLCFEITETAVIDDPTRALAIIGLFRQAGISISIDDYGAGLSSLSYLKQIPANELKIDKSFILTLGRDTSESLMIKSTIDLAHALGMRVVAEGVETEGALNLLREMGADMVQGYFISRPQTREAILTFFNERQERLAHVS